MDDAITQAMLYATQNGGGENSSGQEKQTTKEEEEEEERKRQSQQAVVHAAVEAFAWLENKHGAPPSPSSQWQWLWGEGGWQWEGLFSMRFQHPLAVSTGEERCGAVRSRVCLFVCLV